MTSYIFFVNLTPPYKNAMVRFTAKRFWYYVSVEGFHMPIGSFLMHNFFVRYDGRTTVKREMWMQNSVKSTTELFTFKLRHFKNTVNALRENYWLIFSSSFICHWKNKFKCFIKNFYVTHVWQHIHVIRIWLFKTLHFHWKYPVFFHCLLNETKIYFNKVTRNIALLIWNKNIMQFWFSDSTQVI